MPPVGLAFPVQAFPVPVLACLPLFLAVLGSLVKGAGFERFYNSIHNTLSECIDGLYQIVVDGVPIEEIERAERERYEERRRAFNEDQESDTDGETSAV